MAVETVDSFRQYLADVRDLVEGHKELDREKLLLAVTYTPQDVGRSPDDVYLFEVFDGFHRNQISPYRNFDEVLYGSTEALPLGKGQYLHIILTNPTELEVGVKESWPLACELRQSVESGAYETVFDATSDGRLMEQLRA